jgi:hypothetical protein
MKTGEERRLERGCGSTKIPAPQPTCFGTQNFIKLSEPLDASFMPGFPTKTRKDALCLV